MINLGTFLRIRPLEQKHKLKEDYYSISRGREEEKNSLYGDKSVITIHDPLKRSKDQFDFKFDKIYTQDKSNADVYKDHSRFTDMLLNEGLNEIMISFGHKESGKTFTIYGENNFQLEKNLTDLRIEESDDSRGLVLRTAHDILKRDPGARISISFVDIVMDNIRDLLKYIKREKKTNITHGQNLAIYDDPSKMGYQKSAHQSQEYSISQAQNIEKEFIEVHERPGINGSHYYLKNLTVLENMKDLSDIAFYLEKGAALSEQLNKKLNYTPGLRATQIFHMQVRGSQSHKESQLIFIDMPDYDKLQTNIIDNQKLYESIVINNTFNTIAQIIGGLNNGQYNVQDAPYENSKVTRIIQSMLQQSHPSQQINITFLCCIWPTESRYQEIMNTMMFLDKIQTKKNMMGKTEYRGEMSTNQEKIMQEISKENVEIKFKIDSFKREHVNKLNDLKQKLGLDIALDSILKQKGNQRELQIIKDHKEAIDKTETYSKQNKDIEKRVELIQQQIQDNEFARREIQENFSQKYYILHKKIDKLREEYKQSEMELDNTLRGQMNDRNEELQKILNNTHAMLIENSGLVEQLNETVVKKTQTKDLQSKRINFMKDEGKQNAEDTYRKLLQQQEKEFDQQIKINKEKQEYLLRKKEEEIQKSADDFKSFHEKIKNDQNQARTEIMKLYNIVKKQNQILTNVETGVYSQTAKKIRFASEQKPDLPEKQKFKFLFSTIEKQNQKGRLGQTSQSFITGNNNFNQQLNNIAQSIEEQENTQDLLNKKVETMVNPEELRKLVKDLMQELAKHSASHPQILKGENVEQILQDTEKHKKEYEKASNKNNDVKIQIEAQKRFLERIQLEKIMVPGQPNLNK
ncbi:kinesin motor domain protein [Stylonychia lemnae]|uniref:Kinesin motor domain protein n=1 Tax=Stylonychia lemnae TaxID=5949 RepID=A0A078ATN6_STYLE|nr:kinesin motor domain protein [Stylonychia lemnae]|eukprot:CDW85604.1 kinesin motor domain protein [Stylonychia lemnae]